MSQNQGHPTGDGEEEEIQLTKRSNEYLVLTPK